MVTLESGVSWETYETPLLFVALVLSVMIVLVMWGFRTAQVRWRTRVLFQLGFSIFVARALLVRGLAFDRGWGTNATLVFLVIVEALLIIDIVADSGLFGPRDIPPGDVR
jgi:hypothetical protein